MGFALLTAKSATITVDNNANSAAQYTDLQTAVDDAQDGDTILVAASPINYGYVTLKKTIRLIGAGYKGNATIVDGIYLYRTNSVLSSSGSYISGFRITSSISLNPHYDGAPYSNIYISNVIIERCQIAYIGFSSGQYYKYSNISIRNNIFQNSSIGLGGTIGVSLYPFSNVIIENNVFTGSSITSGVAVSLNSGIPYILYLTSANGVTIKNNIFLDKTDGVFSQVREATVENNIFYGAEPIDVGTYLIDTNEAGDIYDSLYVYLNFNNNLQYYSTQDVTASGWFGVGSDNLNADPLFIDYPLDGSSFSYDHDYHLQVGSPALGAGVTGEDLGIYEGDYPFDPGLKPKGPQMTSVKVVGSPSVPAGGSIQINFSAKVQE